MRTILVTRHLGSLFWAYRAGIPYDLMVEHLDPEQVAEGDVVVGTLPVHLAAEVCGRGARYMHLVIDVPAEQRGRELRRRDLDRCNARLVEFRIEPAAPVREQALPAARLTDGGHKVVVAIATDQNVANLPPILHVARSGDSVLWLCSKPSLRERARWAEPVLAPLGLRTLQVESDCPTRATEIPAWVAAHVRPLLPPDHRVVLVANGGLKPMSRAVEEA
ncbi:MAG: CRISPR-associated protein Csx16, partial [Rubrivivax sp.]|nr:CRISPR-associated protein Csx16 [Rubrivivax sp.]